MSYRYDAQKVREALDAREVARHFNVDEKRGNANKTWQVFRCLFHDDNTPSMHVTADGYDCKACGAKGGVLDLFQKAAGLEASSRREVIDIAGEMFGVTPNYFTHPQHRRPAPRPARRPPTPPPSPDTAEQSAPARDLLTELWRLIEPRGLTLEAHDWLTSRGLDPQRAHEEGCRDLEAARAEVLALLDGASDEELQAASLLNSKGELWWPLRAMRQGWPLIDRDGVITHDRGVLIPMWRAGESRPWRWRWRYIDKAHDPKVQGQPNPVSGELFGAQHLPDASSVIVCEGEPDYLSLVEVLEDHEAVAPVGLCGDKNLAGWMELAPRDGRIIMAVHVDRDKQGQRPGLAEHKVYRELAEQLAEQGGEALEAARRWSIIDVDGKEADLNDLHKEGRLAADVARWLGDDHGELDGEWRALLDETATRLRQEAMARALEDHAREARRTYINPMVTPDAPISLDGVEARITALVDEAITRRERLSVAIPPGAGKTWSTAKRLAWHLAQGSITSLDVLSPSKATRDAMPEALRRGLKEVGWSTRREELDAQMTPQPARSDENCYRFDLWKVASRINPLGGITMCQLCEHGPGMAPKGGECKYWEDHANRGDDVRVMTQHKLMLTEGHITELEDVRRARQVRFEWKDMTRAALSGSLLEVHTRNTKHVTHITLIESEQGQDIAPPEHVIGEDGEPRRTAAGERTLLEFIASQLGCEPDRAAIVERVQGGNVDECEREVLVVDELLLGAMREQLAASLDDLNWLRIELGMGSEAWAQVSDMLEASRQTVSANPIRHARVDAAPLARAFEGVELASIDVENLQAEELEEALSNPAARRDEERQAMLTDCHDWRLVPAFVRAIQTGFIECYFQGGELHLTTLRQLDLERYHTVIALDATSTPQVARAIYGEQVRHEAIAVERPTEHLNIFRVDYDLSKSHLAGGIFERERKRTLHHALHTLTDSPDTLHITHKALLDPQHVSVEGSASQMFEALEGHVIYYGGGESTGWNGAENARVVAADTYFPNSNAVGSLAATLCLMSGEDWQDAQTRRRWLDEARFLEEGRAIIQIIERARTWRASAERPITLILASARSLAPLGYPETPYTGQGGCEAVQVIDADELIYYATGEAHGPGGLLAATRHAVHNHEGVWSPAMEQKQGRAPTSLEIWSKWLNSAQNAGVSQCCPKWDCHSWAIDRLFFDERLNTQQTRSECGGVTMLSQMGVYSKPIWDNTVTPPHEIRGCGTFDHDEDEQDLSALSTMVLNHARKEGGGIQNYASRHGYRIVLAGDEHRGPGFQFICDKRLEDAQLVNRFERIETLAWVELDGVRALLNPPPDFDAWLMALPSLEDVSWSTLAEHLGVSVPTARRRAREVECGTLEALRGRWQELHHAAQPVETPGATDKNYQSEAIAPAQNAGVSNTCTVWDSHDSDWFELAARHAQSELEEGEHLDQLAAEYAAALVDDVSAVAPIEPPGRVDDLGPVGPKQEQEAPAPVHRSSGEIPESPPGHVRVEARPATPPPRRTSEAPSPPAPMPPAPADDGRDVMELAARLEMDAEQVPTNTPPIASLDVTRARWMAQMKRWRLSAHYAPGNPERWWPRTYEEWRERVEAGVCVVDLPDVMELAALLDGPHGHVLAAMLARLDAPSTPSSAPRRAPGIVQAAPATQPPPAPPALMWSRGRGDEVRAYTPLARRAPVQLLQPPFSWLDVEMGRPFGLLRRLLEIDEQGRPLFGQLTTRPRVMRQQRTRLLEVLGARATTLAEHVEADAEQVDPLEVRMWHAWPPGRREEAERINSRIIQTINGWRHHLGAAFEAISHEDIERVACRNVEHDSPPPSIPVTLHDDLFAVELFLHWHTSRAGQGRPFESVEQLARSVYLEGRHASEVHRIPLAECVVMQGERVAGQATLASMSRRIEQEVASRGWRREVFDVDFYVRAGGRLHRLDSINPWLVMARGILHARREALENRRRG